MRYLLLLIPFSVILMLGIIVTVAIEVDSTGNADLVNHVRYEEFKACKLESIKVKSACVHDMELCDQLADEYVKRCLDQSVEN